MSDLRLGFGRFIKLGGGLIARLCLGLLWLLGVSFYSELSTSLALIYLLALLGLFLGLHVVSAWPSAWHLGETLPATATHTSQGPANLLVLPNDAVQRYQLPLIWLAILLLTLGQICLYVLFGLIEKNAPQVGPATLIGAIFVAPVVEEFAARLWLQGFLARYCPAWVAVILAAALFALAHGLDQTAQFWFHFASGLIYGSALVATRSIWVPVSMHFVHNALIGGLDQSADLADVLTRLTQAPPDWFFILCGLLLLGGASLWLVWLRSIHLLKR